MTKERALKLLESAPCDDKPSKLNRVFTRKEATQIIKEGIDGLPDGGWFTGLGAHLMEKRLWQVVKDQRRPKYPVEHRYIPRREWYNG